MDIMRPFGPTITRTYLDDDIYDKFIDLTDNILLDINRENVGHRLAGKIKEQIDIPLYTLVEYGLKEFLLEGYAVNQNKLKGQSQKIKQLETTIKSIVEASHQKELSNTEAKGILNLIQDYTLALDFKINQAVFPLLDRLDKMVLNYGGRVYLTKDVRMTEETFKRSYSQWETFMACRESVGAHRVFNSLQSKRLGL